MLKALASFGHRNDVMISYNLILVTLMYLVTYYGVPSLFSSSCSLERGEERERPSRWQEVGLVTDLPST